MSNEELRLSQCEGKTPLKASVAKKLKVKYAKKGRPSSAYKCRFCGHWHIGSQALVRPQR